MSVIFTCGHKAKDDEDGWTISTKAYTRENNRAVDYRTVCNNCYHVYEMEELVLFGEADVAKWLEEAATEIERLNNIKAGIDRNTDNKEYSIGTEESYNDFIKYRNRL